MGISTTISDSDSLIRVSELEARPPGRQNLLGPARLGPARLFNEMRMTNCLFLLRKRLQPTEFSHNIAGTAAPYHINIGDATVKRLRSRPRGFGDGWAINF